MSDIKYINTWFTIDDKTRIENSGFDCKLWDILQFNQFQYVGIISMHR